MPSALGVVANVSASASQGPLFVDRVTLVGDALYPTAGTVGFAAALKALRGDSREIVSVVDEGVATNSIQYDKTNDKLLCYVRATGLQVANNVDLSGTTFKLVVTSK
jgi:hypothetical protein